MVILVDGELDMVMVVASGGCIWSKCYWCYCSTLQFRLDAPTVTIPAVHHKQVWPIVQPPLMKSKLEVYNKPRYSLLYHMHSTRPNLPQLVSAASNQLEWLLKSTNCIAENFHWDVDVMLNINLTSGTRKLHGYQLNLNLLPCTVTDDKMVM